jgi:nucleoside-diphosphate-sugar epimerase
MALYLVTGGAGFIGSNVVEELLRRGERVRILDNFSTGKRDNVTEIQKILKNENDPHSLQRLELIEGDVRSYQTVREAVDDVDFILHQAALPSIPRSIKDPITTNEVNVVGTLNILNAAIECKPNRVIYASSSSVYGDLATFPLTEEMLPRPLSPYAASKSAAEKYCQVFTRLYGLKTIVLRYFNVFGPRQDPVSYYSAAIPKFIRLMKRGQSPTIYGDGEQSRDFTYVSNVVEANLLVCEKSLEGLSGEIFNVACGRSVTINELVSSINELLGTKIAPTYADSRPGDVRHSLSSIDKARQLLGFEPKVAFYEGLSKLMGKVGEEQSQ